MDVYKQSNTLPLEDLDLITKFLGILTKVNSRVSSDKSTSEDNLLKKPKGLIDKLILEMETEVDLESFVKYSKAEGFDVVGKHLRDKRYYVILTDNRGRRVWNHLLHRDNQSFRKLTINPSDFGSLNDLESFLEKIYGQDIFDSKISRIDCTVDYFQPLKNVLRGFDIPNKSAKSEYSDETAWTGLKVGKKNDKIVVYDKQKESGVNFPMTRIERQMTGTKVPVKYLKDLRSYLSDLVSCNPLEGLVTNYIEFIRPLNKMNDARESKFNELKALVNHDGYFQTRKKLNENRNFRRDYSDFYLLIPYKKQPYQIFLESMKTYIFEGEK